LPIKAHLGHCAGASGALSALVAAKALATGHVPPTLHIDQPDETLAVRFSREPAALAEGHDSRALVNAYGFGGNNVSVILEAAHHG
jgi:3-oxoacyl-[acyl-carrier-protein] synthase II